MESNRNWHTNLETYELCGSRIPQIRMDGRSQGRLDINCSHQPNTLKPIILQKGFWCFQKNNLSFFELQYLGDLPPRDLFPTFITIFFPSELTCFGTSKFDVKGGSQMSMGSLWNYLFRCPQNLANEDDNKGSMALCRSRIVLVLHQCNA